MSAIYNDIVEIIRAANTRIILDQLSAETDLRDLGADSLDLMNILLSVQEKYGIEIPDSELDALSNINAILAFLHSNSQ